MNLEAKYQAERDKHRKSPEEKNPCYKEHEISLQCLDRTNYNRDLCLHHFENYRNCRAFWNFVYKERRRKGMKPYIPVPEERAAAKQEYLPHFKGI